MKGFNNYTEREEFSIFKKFFLDHGRCKEMKKKEYFAECFKEYVGNHQDKALSRHMPPMSRKVCSAMSVRMKTDVNTL